MGKITKSKLVMTEKTPCFWVPQDVIFFLGTEGLIAFNVFTRSHVEFDAVGLIDFLKTPKQISEIESFIQNQSIGRGVRDVTWFSSEAGLLTDPSNLCRNPKTQWLSQASEIVQLLQNRWILISNEKGYRARFGVKQNIFDNQHFGNFHQQLGHQLRIVKRENPDHWWARQKYKDGKEELQDNLYKFIQYSFYQKHFKPENVCGKKILDVGCGTGFYSRHLARQGASVTGIDPNPEYIERAQSVAGNLGANFQVIDIAAGDSLKVLPSDAFDFIIFQDALMFYFVPYGNKKLNTRKTVLTELKRALKFGGILMVMEPHGIFWLQPWLGGMENPFTILTEYAFKTYGVTPTLSQLSEAFEEAGLKIKRIHEPPVSDQAKSFEPRGYAISRQFPQWWVFELVK